MIKILQGSAVTQIVLGGLTIHPPVASFVQCIVYVPRVMKIG